MASSRISQILPTVKCSNCSEGVGISELGDHVCSRANPPRVVAPHSNQLPFRPNPLAGNTALMSFQQPLTPSDGHERSWSTPSRRGPIPPSNGVKSSASLSGPIRIDERVVPETELGIDTKTGGEAGMAGVGRRGFAAAVRAAMYVSLTAPPANRRPVTSPRFLDIDTASNGEFFLVSFFHFLRSILTSHRYPASFCQFRLLITISWSSVSPLSSRIDSRVFHKIITAFSNVPFSEAALSSCPNQLVC